MKFRAGFFKVMWTVILVQSCDAAHILEKHEFSGSACKPKQLTALTKSNIEACLTSFDEANGKHLATWSPGFPKLRVDQDSPVVGSHVQCSLLFMGQSLQEILEDQKNNLNPDDVALHAKLKDAVARVDMLAGCMKSTLGGSCSPRPSPPKLPITAFERKQWGHTLLKAARGYLNWLGQKISVQNIQTNVKTKDTKAKLKKHVNWSPLLSSLKQDGVSG